MNNDLLNTLWQQTEIWRLFATFFAGIIVGYVYFASLHWSIEHLGEFKHKYRMFATVALLRMSMFFAVLVLACQRNVILILLYILAFFFTRIFMIWHFKNSDDKKEEKLDGMES